MTKTINQTKVKDRLLGGKKVSETKVTEQDGLPRWGYSRNWGFGISIDKLTQQLEGEGVDTFNKPFDQLMATLTQRSPRRLTRAS